MRSHLGPWRGNPPKHRRISVTADGKRVVSGSYDKTIKVWNLETGKEERTLSGHSEWVTAVSVTAESITALPPGLGGNGVLGGFALPLPLVFFFLFLTPPALWALSRRARNQAQHALHGNGRRGRGRGRGQGLTSSSSPPPSKQATVKARSTNEDAVAKTTKVGQRFRSSPSSLRAQAAGKATLRQDLEAAGYTVNVEMGPNDLLHLYRRRLTPRSRTALVEAVGASHIIGDDELDADVARGGVRHHQLWKVSTKYPWGSASQPWPLLVFPDHLTRTQGMVAGKLAQNANLKGVILAVSVPRQVVDDANDWSTFSAKADEILTSGWDESLALASVTAFLEPPSLLRCPASSTTIPPAWEECPLPPRYALVALKVVRKEAAPSSPSFLKLGSFQSWKEIQAADRAGVARICLEVDLVHRPKGGKDVNTFSRKALAELVALTSTSSALPPLRGLVVKVDVVIGFVDLPRGLAGQLLRVSGAARGVFARPWLGATEEFPLPDGFSASSHRVVWAKVDRFSDVETAALNEAQVEYAGLICPRQSGELGIRVPRASDCAALRQCLEGDFSARVKISSKRRFILRATNVPLAMLDKLAHLVARVDPDLTVVSQRVLHATHDSLAVDITVETKDVSLPSAEEWQLTGWLPSCADQAPPASTPPCS